MKYFAPLTAACLWIVATPASAFVYFSVSGSDSSSNGGLQTYGAVGGSASIAFDLTRFLRLGYTYKQQYQTAKGFAGAAANQCTDITDLTGCEDYASSTKEVANSIDLTIILYEGKTFTPFLLAGAIRKDYQTTTQTGATVSNVTYSEPVPRPNAGIGMYIRLNQDFSFKITYTISQGERLEDPTTKVVDKVLDKETDIGISYQL